MLRSASWAVASTVAASKPLLKRSEKGAVASWLTGGRLGAGARALCRSLGRLWAGIMDGGAQAPISSTGHDGVFVCRAGTGMEQVATCVPCAALCPLGLRTQHLRLLYSVFCFAGRLDGVGRGQDRGGRTGGGRLGNTWN